MKPRCCCYFEVCTEVMVAVVDTEMCKIEKMFFCTEMRAKSSLEKI